MTDVLTHYSPIVIESWLMKMKSDDHERRTYRNTYTHTHTSLLCTECPLLIHSRLLLIIYPLSFMTGFDHLVCLEWRSTTRSIHPSTLIIQSQGQTSTIPVCFEQKDKVHGANVLYTDRHLNEHRWILGMNSTRFQTMNLLDVRILY